MYTCRFIIPPYWGHDSYNAKCLPSLYYNLNLSVCLFVWSFSSHSRIFHSHGDVTVTVKGCKSWPMLGTYGQWAVKVLQRATSTITREIRLKWSSPRTSDAHNSCRAFMSGAVTTCFYDLSLSQLGFEHPIFCLAMRTLYTTAPQLRLKILQIKFPVCLFVWQLFYLHQIYFLIWKHLR